MTVRHHHSTEHGDSTASPFDAMRLGGVLLLRVEHEHEHAYLAWEGGFVYRPGRRIRVIHSAPAGVPTWTVEILEHGRREPIASETQIGGDVRDALGTLRTDATLAADALDTLESAARAEAAQ